ncbi:MAG TPA: hypothetical protein VN516_03920, partial [Candidatus Baltobacteraceae bacterium]|nr:hypothetical protein [Candidatus Baltobacteraceae bacterium]
CMKLPRCYVCGMPVKDGTTLPDGRILCARDAKSAVLDVDEAKRICADVQNDLNKMFSRFTEFPTDVDISAIDRIDVNSMADTVGNSYESPDILGVYHGAEVGGKLQHQVRLLTGQPANRLRDVCAHELAHAWAKANVTAERHAHIDRDAEEGFCEMVGYLLVDSQNDEAEKKRILANHYTRGQVQLFLAAEQRYGFEQILDWMQNGETSRLVDGHLEEVRNIKTSSSASAEIHSSNNRGGGNVKTVVSSGPATIMLQSILWGPKPMAIINGRSFYVNDEAKIKIGTNSISIQCLAIQTNSVRVLDFSSGEKKEIFLLPK